MEKYLQVFISAEGMEQATKIRDSLISQKLIPGGPVLQGPAKFLWKRKTVEMDYCYIFAYTIRDYKEKLIADVKKNSAEELPMITFTAFEANQELLDWIDRTIG